MLLAYLFMSINNQIWLNDFFYHINPNNYIAFLDRFDVQISADMVKKNKWTPVFIKQIYGTAHWVSVYIALALSLFFLNYTKANKKYFVAFTVASIAITSFVIHESVHLSYVGLNMHERYMFTMIIPILIAFAILVPLNEGVSKRFSQGKISVNLLLGLFFFAVLFLSRNPTYYADLASSWSLYNSVINVFSFWIFLLGVGLLLFSANGNLKSENNRVPMLSAIAGFCIIILYSSIWGNIKSEYQTWRRVEGRIQSFEKLKSVQMTYSDKLLIANIEANRNIKNYFQYAYVSGVIDRDAYLKIRASEFDENKFIKDEMNLISNGEYTHVLIGENEDEINMKAKKYNIQFSKQFSIMGNFLYKIKEIEND